MNRFDIREHGASILVAALSSTFGVTLMLITDALAVMINSDPATSESHTVRFVLGFIAVVFLAIALYVGAVVTSNTFSTIIAGRTRTIALLRLIGATARDQRRSVAREGLLVGLIGGVLGFALGVGVNALLLAVVVPSLGVPPFLHFNYVTPSAILPVVAVILTTWLASWIGSRRVLVVTPMQAIGAATERSVEDVVTKRGRNAVAATLFVIGTLVLIASVLLGQATPIALLPGVLGGILSFTGVVLAAGVIMPPALRFVGALLGRSTSARMAAQNSVRYPERSARTTVGLVIGVTLVTMFVVALQTVLALIAISRAAQPETYQGTAPIISAVAIIFSVIGGFSALIAAIGLVNNMSLSVLQRTRELGLLRALGFTVRQVRQLIVAESAQLTIAAVLVGLVLGTFYGWAGAECLLGALSGGTGPVAPAVPLLLIAIVAAASLLLTWLASAGPSRRATRVAPVAALAVE